MKNLKFLIPSILVMIAIFMGSNDPVSGEKSDFITKNIWKIITFITSYEPNETQELFTSFIIRKIAHITEYMILTLSYYFGLHNTSKTKSFKKIYLLALIGSILYAISDEYHQTFIAGRVGTYKDVIVDSVGGFISYFVLKLFIK